ncbi:MAG: zinc ABC transporter substrate-binding protein [Candidatus Kerfeldbacteria bacterium]|nr:zinc ABC transporter substrate-binding protein [Candidatus Kerfeldbacteria bacterium]
MKRFIIITITILVLVSLGVASYMTKRFNTSSALFRSSDETISVVATFYPLGHFAEQVGGDAVTVTVITPSGVEPHDYAATPHDIATILQADLFLRNGQGLDPWADQITSTEFINQSAISITMTDQVQLRKDVDAALDPHIWLDPVLAQDQIALIRDALIQLDPNKAASYQAKADSYINSLAELDRQFSIGLTNCRVRTIVTAHDAFGYLGERYTIGLLPVAGLSPEATPSAKTLADISSQIQAHRINYIFAEPLVQTQFADVIAEQTNATVLVLNPLEGLTAEEVTAGKNYLTVMTENLNNLRLAMDCQ